MSEKLAFWQQLVKSGHASSIKEGDGGDDEESKLSKDLKEFQCDVATNSEICHIGEDEST